MNNNSFIYYRKLMKIFYNNAVKENYYKLYKYELNKMNV